MSGHSKWSTIKRQKGAADIKRGQTFTKVANAITIAVKLSGSGDPETNSRLRMALEGARDVNMPKDNIQRAIDRGMGRGEGGNLEEFLYEGFGPGKVAFLVEGVTDNRMRTTQGIKNIFERNGGSLAGQGSVAYMFERKGEMKIKSHPTAVGSKVKNEAGFLLRNKEDEMLELIDLGAEDVEDFEETDPQTGEIIQKYLIYVESPELNTMSNRITQAGYRVESSEIVYKPNVLTQINDRETAQKILDFASKLEDNDDVQKVYANFDIKL